MQRISSLALPTPPYRLNLNSSIAQGLVMWLPLIDSRIIDYMSGLAFTKSLTPPALTPSAIGPTWLFTAASATNLLSSSTPITGPPLTMACWFYPAAVVNQRDFISIGQPNNANDCFSLQQRANAGVGARVNDSSASAVAAVSTKNVVISTWQLAVATFTSSTSRSAYLDGANKGTSSTSKTPSGVSRIGIACQSTSTPTSSFGGNLVNCCIWNRVLSDSEIWSLYDPATRWSLFAAPLWQGVSINDPNAGVVMNRPAGRPVMRTGVPIQILRI